MENHERIRRLFGRFLARECNEEELRQLFSWFGTADEVVLRQLIRGEMEKPENVEGARERERPEAAADEERKAALERVRLGIRERQREDRARGPVFRRMLRYAAAVILLTAAGAGGYLFLAGQTGAESQGRYDHDALPGRSRAILTLANGSRIDLDTAANGPLASQESFSISKDKDGLITYRVQGSGEDAAPATYNTITTPKGGKYQVVLPDGSRIWLNAASSLTYPTQFNGSVRRVELEGEGYFEVARNERQPFVVASRGQEITVLGTRFNVNAYTDGAGIRTTLLEGSVQVARLPSGETRLLKPGQQSTVQAGNIRVAAADTASSVGWKNGVFIFHNTSLREIMLQLRRWYDIEVDMDNMKELSGEIFYGEIDRDARLSEVLDMIQSTSKVRFEIKERRLEVRKEN